MKKLFTCFLIAGSMGMAHAQQKASQPNLSAFTRMYLQACKDRKDSDQPVPNYVYKIINNKRYISSFIKVNSDIDQSKLQAIGVHVGTKAGSIWTVQIPVESVEQFVTVTGINYIDLDVPVFPLLDNARKTTKADSAQSGINLPMQMTGKNVVVGVIDAGFDFDHPTMYDTLHGEYRVKRVWAQKIAGTPPTGFAYGKEMTDSNAIRTQGYDTAITSHGSHVAGIAAGSGYGSNVANKRFRGMAYESDMVFVGIMPAPSQWLAAGATDIIDGMSYIFNYAASVSKPAVVNLSWGSTIGPHDGYSLFSQATDALTGPGKIFVCAAGNDGEDTIHLQKTFTPTDTVVSTFVTFSQFLDSLNQKTWIDVWGDTGQSFCMNFKLYDSANAIDSTPYVCIANTSQAFHLIGSNGDTCFVTVSMVASEYNQKPHAVVYLYSKLHDNICMNTKGTAGTVDLWEGYIIPPTGYYGAMKKLGYPWAVSGDVNMTVSDIGSTRSAITVGAYVSKTTFTNISGASYMYSGTLKAIASFSSHGPTADYRTKPDITAPGLALASALSSYDSTNLPTGENYVTVISATTIGGRTYPYGMEGGTSMASPCVSGIIAMMLQLYPGLTSDSAKSIMTATAIVDANTGTIPAGGSNIWGFGKINAYSAVKYMAGTVSVKNTLNTDPLDCILYPNPSKGSFTIDYRSNSVEQLTVEVYDIAGKLISSTPWFVHNGYNSRSFSSAALAKGLYFTKISSPRGYNVIKMGVE